MRQKYAAIIVSLILILTIVPVYAANESVVNETKFIDTFEQKFNDKESTTVGNTNVVAFFNRLLDDYIPFYLRISFIVGLCISLLATAFYSGRNDPSKMRAYRLMAIFMFLGLFIYQAMLWMMQLIYSLLMLIWGIQ